MNKKILLAVGLIFCAARILFANEHEMPVIPPSEELAQMKKFVGVWEGTANTNGETKPAKIEYSLTSGGTAVMEKLFSGTPHEMVSVYYDEDGRLTMKHFCMLPVKPQMDLISSKKDQLIFDFSPVNKIDPKAMHMHSLTLSFVKDGELTQSWTSWKDGVAQPATVIAVKKT